MYENYFITEEGLLFNKYKKKLSPVDNGRGYLIVNINIKGKRKCKAIHRIVAEAFIPNPENLPEVNHIDGDRYNNTVSNLEWITHGNNIRHSYKLQNRTATGSSNANCKTEETIVKEICEYLSKGFKASEVRDFGYSYSLVRKIKSKQNWHHISINYNF